MDNITYIKITDTDPVASYLATTINQQLDLGKEVLWLVPGGSGIAVAIKTARLLARSDVQKLTVSLTDERYGPVGHADSNWQQLKKAGFEVPGARLRPALDGSAIDKTTHSYSEFLQDQLDRGVYSVALAGMGHDGHIFGIKPRSPSVDSNKLVINYDWDDYQRITSTKQLIKMLDEIVLFAMGNEKHQQLDDLEKNLPVSDQPAQLLKAAKKVIVYNDYKGEKI